MSRLGSFEPQATFPTYECHLEDEQYLFCKCHPLQISNIYFVGLDSLRCSVAQLLCCVLPDTGVAGPQVPVGPGRVRWCHRAVCALRAHLATGHRPLQQVSSHQ